jgi:hypothetical protein
MTLALHSAPDRGVLLRHSRWDALLIALALLHGGVLLVCPSLPVVALGVWWNSNTVAHYFIHAPFFVSRRWNVLFDLYLSGLLGIPQTLWRERHLAHHAGVTWQFRFSGRLLMETLAVLAVWIALLIFAPRFFLTAYLPGYALGLCLCALHGYYEHAHGTISHHGTLYNLLFFNDGYHVEHHAAPGLHWRRLPQRAVAEIPLSRWPAVFRWLDAFTLQGLERCVLRCRPLQWFLINRHEQAFRRQLSRVPEVRRVAIVGGGLFPRTLLILQRLLPDARLVVIDRSAANLRIAYPFFRQEVECIHATYEPELVADFDLMIIPLAFIGDREAIYRQPPTRAVLIHDWLWHCRGTGAIVSFFLLKRLNLVLR